MRKFSSYGPVDTRLHYYAPRTELIDQGYQQLLGEAPEIGGHYITVWAPRQTGKTWLMQQVVKKIQEHGDFEVAILTMQSAKEVNTVEEVLEVLVSNLRYWFNKDFPDISAWLELPQLFTNKYFSKPVILVLDEFDALREEFINKFANEFRNIYIERATQIDKKSDEKRYLLHGLALIGVRSVLGIENVTGSPFNVQRSVHIPNLTLAEVDGMFKWYERESGQKVEQAVIERLFYETQGQPGLTCWLGELLTETYNEKNPSLTMQDFEIAYAAAVEALPNNNILNIISKARQEPYKQLVLEMFKTEEKIPFRYDDTMINFLYMNGVVDWELVAKTKRYLRFSSPFVQKRLFNYFSNELFRVVGKLYEPFEDLTDAITEKGLNVKNLLRRYQAYLQKNRGWLLENAPRRKDLRIYEAVYHFNLYMYLQAFLRSKKGEVYPEFPTGNGQIDLIIKYQGQVYGLEVKSYTDESGYKEALGQAARYGQRLQLGEISLAFFVEAIDEANRARYEVVYVDQETGVTVIPIFVEIGSREFGAN